jgi:glycosyltransferase involved in cell wall biosynthesis
MPLVSVLMPCYNAADTLGEALESLSGQTLGNFEVIAVDDGSDDGTLDILAARTAQDRRVRILRQPHQGIVSALNNGLAACRAHYIARMDADDRAHPTRLERQLIYLEEHPEASLVGCQVRGAPLEALRGGFARYLDWQNSLLTDAEIRREIFVECPLAHPSVTLRRDWVDRAGAYQEHGWAEDYDLWLRLYLAGAQFAKLSEVLLDWRDRPDRLTRSDPRYSLENFLRAKAHYLPRGPIRDRDAVILWGAGMIGRRLSKHLVREEVPLAAFVDIDPKKIGRTFRGLSIFGPEAIPELWRRYKHPALLAAVGARGARQLIRARLNLLGLVEGQDWWGVA